MFPVLDMIGDNAQGKRFGLSDGLLPSLSIRYYSRKFADFGDPARILFQFSFNGKLHHDLLILTNMTLNKALNDSRSPFPLLEISMSKYPCKSKLAGGMGFNPV